MAKADNLIIEGKCFINNPALNVEFIQNLKNTIINYMQKRGYVNIDNPLPFKDNFLCIKFMLGSRDIYPSKQLELKKRLHLISQTKYNSELYFSWLKTRRVDIPFEITFLISQKKYKDLLGVEIEMCSKPVILYKIMQLNTSFPYEELEYSNIISSNKQFVYEVMKALSSEIIEKPNVRSYFFNEKFNIPLKYELEKYGFTKVSKIISDGFIKLNKGETKEALDELRSAIELFTKEIVDRISEKTHPQTKIGNNLEILRNNNIIDEKISGMLISIYYNNLWNYISSEISHKREKISIKECKFFYSLFEIYVTYLINKIIK